MEKAKVFERIYREYLDQVGRLDLADIRDRLGIEKEKDAAVIPFYGRLYRVSKNGVQDPQGKRPSHSVSVILCKYLLLCPKTAPANSGQWVTYKDFKDATPFAGGFAQNAEQPIAKRFSGRLDDLKKASAQLSGRQADLGISSDLTMRFDPLPKVPLVMLFNDEDEDFPSQCSLLFRQSAESYLDMECLAMVGWVLSEWMAGWAL